MTRDGFTWDVGPFADFGGLGAGGHLEMGESWADCAVREIKEETDLDLDPATVEHVLTTNDVFDAESKHYITIFVRARVRAGSASLKNMEPHKCEGWSFVDWGGLRGGKHPLFLPLKHAVESKGFDPFKGLA
jgi:8-oxo-dGTP diphosphatase